MIKQILYLSTILILPAFAAIADDRSHESGSVIPEVTIQFMAENVIISVKQNSL
mgnify:CR=1 FL=1